MYLYSRKSGMFSVSSLYKHSFLIQEKLLMVRSLIVKLALFEEVKEEKLYQTFPFSENVLTCISLLPFVVKRKKNIFPIV